MMHFFECEAVWYSLSEKHIFVEVFRRLVENRRWMQVFSMIGEMMIVWSEYLPTFGLDTDELKSLVELL